jgi:CubicO group peptidase (beta-lactamase class C family)
MISRRAFLGGAVSVGGLALASGNAAAALLRSGEADWPRVQAFLDSYIKGGQLGGAAASVGRGTAPATFLSAGTIARDSRRAVDADTLWRVYSMTKPVTGMAAMMLIDDGKLALDQDIADFIPGFASPRVLVDPARDLTSRPAKGPITVRHLLTHSAGLGYTIVTRGPLLAEYFRLGLTPFAVGRIPLPGSPNSVTAPSLKEFADRLATLPLIADPGTKWSYSVSLDLLGRVIEVASGMAFDRFLQDRMFTPLGMTSTFFTVPDSELGRMSTNYFETPLGQVAADAGTNTVYADPPAFPFGGAGLVSSARDYDRFLAMLAGEGSVDGVRLMKPETARIAMSNLLPPGVTVDGAGFGAGGRVTLKAGQFGQGVGTFGWGGAAATVAFVDRVRGVRGGGYAQFMPDTTYPFTTDFARSVYTSL